MDDHDFSVPEVGLDEVGPDEVGLDEVGHDGVEHLVLNEVAFEEVMVTRVDEQGVVAFELVNVAFYGAEKVTRAD